MPAEPILLSLSSAIRWDDVGRIYLGLLGYVGIFGALGFRFGVLRRVTDLSAEAQVLRAAERGAARIGLVGSVLLVLRLFGAAAHDAAQNQVGILHAAVATGPRFLAQIAFALMLVVAFAFAMRGGQVAWRFAAGVGVALTLRNAVTGRWTTLVNPLHAVSASVWLGTLFVLMAAGLPAILRDRDLEGRRGAMVAELARRFSPVALGAAAVLGLTGVVTSWLHLKSLPALWTTSYGLALDVKLALVAVVVALGAWNWRRMLPQLGVDEAAHTLRRSSAAELAFAAVVLLVTSILLTLPTPALPAR